MNEILFIIFGDTSFRKLDNVQTHPSSNLFPSHAKVFSSISISAKQFLVDDLFLNWSGIYFKSGEKTVYSGFKDTTFGQKLQILELPQSEFTEIECGFQTFFGITPHKTCFRFDNTTFEPKAITLNQSDELLVQSVCTEDIYTAILTPDGRVFSLKPTTSSLMHLPLSVTIKKVACGKDHVLLLSTNGRIFSYGSGSHGQLGRGSIENTTEPSVIDALDGLEMLDIEAGGWHSASISYAGDLYMWGWNESGQLGLPCAELQENILPLNEIETVCSLPKIIDFGEDRKVVSVACGSRHTVAITDDNFVWSWGRNTHGELGHENIFLVDKPTKILLPQNFAPKSIKCKFWNSLITGYFKHEKV